MTEKLTETVRTLMENVKYEYYFPDYRNYFREALELERRRRLNCWDREPDWGPEATNMRIKRDMQLLKEGKIRPPVPHPPRLKTNRPGSKTSKPFNKH